MSTKADKIKILAQFSGHHPDDVERDLPILARARKDVLWGINSFFVRGDPWLWSDLTPFQVEIVKRLESGYPKCCEVLPRGHAKTTLISRAWTAYRVGLGIEPYTIIYSLTEDGREGNMEAIDMIAKDEEFYDLQWLMHYVHGPNVASASGNKIKWGNGAITEFRSLLGESRGTNRPRAGGRPSLILLDDVIPTDAIDSETIRRKIVQRYLSMVRPMGRAGSRIVIVGTVMDIEDLIGMIITGRIKGYLVTPPQHRRAYDPQTHKVLFPEKHTYEELMQVYQDEYVSTGNVRLWKREQLNDPSGESTHPFTNYAYKLPTFAPKAMGHAQMAMDKTLAIDNAHGAGRDFFVVMEYWRAYDRRRYIPAATVSNEMNMVQRLDEVLRYVLRRAPHRIVIQRTAESIDFIEALRDYMKERGAYVKIETPSPGNTKGAKNSRIYSWLQPLLDDDMLHVPCARDDGELPAWVQHFNSELANFNMTRSGNVDDCLDTAALAEEASKEPDEIIAEVRTGNPVIDDLMNTIIDEQNQAKTGRYNRRMRWL